MWRKNRRPSSSFCYGTDLNRNFGYQWATGGSSSNPCSDTYHGGSPMIENEAKALENFWKSFGYIKDNNQIYQRGFP